MSDLDSESGKKFRKYVSQAEALAKMQRFCVYQDRCHQEVRSKLLEMGIFGESLEEIIAGLVAEGFLNEERFARSFARGRFRLKQWGRYKIDLELRQRNISEYCRRKALTEIDDAEYLDTLLDLLTKKLAESGADLTPLDVQKAARYAIGRGFEPELVWSALERMR
jgi:regulatory protein